MEVVGEKHFSLFVRVLVRFLAVKNQWRSPWRPPGPSSTSATSKTKHRLILASCIKILSSSLRHEQVAQYILQVWFLFSTSLWDIFITFVLIQYYIVKYLVFPSKPNISTFTHHNSSLSIPPQKARKIQDFGTTPAASMKRGDGRKTEGNTSYADFWII